MRIILLDKRDMFLADIQTTLMLDDWNTILVGQSTNADSVEKLVERGNIDAIAISDEILMDRAEWIFPNVAVVGYVTTRNGAEAFKQRNIPYYEEIVLNTETLLTQLENGLPANVFTQPTEKVEEKIVPKVEPVIEVKPEPVYMETKEPLTKAPEAETTPIPQKREEPASPVQNTEAKGSLRDRLINTSVLKAPEEVSVVEDKKRETEIVTVYAAKGGVGKTTIATELAAQLADVVIGRGRLRVCIVDCNIDFGDVLLTLDYDAKDTFRNLTLWAAEVRERIGRGEDPKTISYTKEEIEKHLQVKKFNNAEIYGLVAPVTHVDSMLIGDEFDIILENLKKNGDFDFIICDTGNNTRSVTMAALEQADTILLVATQDVSTASCNNEFLEAMQMTNFDTTKIKLIINCIMPWKYTHVAVEDVEKLFPYDCIAHLHRSPEITKANNCSQPIVLTDPNHQFSKEMRKIAKMLTVDFQVSQFDTPEKRGFKSKLKNIFKK